MDSKFRIIILLFSIVCICSAACSYKPYADTNKVYKQQAKAFTKELNNLPLVDSAFPAAYPVGTINFNLRKPNYVIIHHTAQKSCEQTLKTFTTRATQVSSHYVICKDGTIHHMLNDYLRAWHGGVGSWGNVTDINSVSLGIEIDNDGFENFTEPQISSLLYLLGKLKKNYSIPAANFIGHADIAPTRKNDPNVHFPWKRLATEGYGLWYDENASTPIPADFNNLYALRLIGYNVNDSVAAMRAFKRHYLGIDKDSVNVPREQQVLWQLAQKSLN